MSAPIRVQLSRKKGFKMPPNTVSVARPSKWGNPFVVGWYPCARNGRGEQVDQARAVKLFLRLLKEGKTAPFNLADIREHLRGKNLACYCKPGTPCHADILLFIANA